MDNFRDSYFQVDWDLTARRLRGTFWGKQYDTGRGFAVTVINGGQVVTATNEVLRLKWEKPDKTTGYVNATIVNGKFIVENIDQMFTVQGRVRADFELSVGGESLASVTFYVSVEKAVAVDAIESSSDFSAFQQSVADFSTAVAGVTSDSEVILARGTKATLGARLDASDAQLNDAAQRIDNLVNTPVPTGEIIAEEIIDARNGEANLKTRLDKEKQEITAQLAQAETFSGQADFVELIKNRTNYKVLSVKKIDTPYEALQVFCHDGNQHITHEWKKNNNDDFWIYNVAYGGQITVAPDYLKSTASKSGTWTTMDGSGNVYTTEIGATFTVQINGSTLQLNHMTDNRGGMFKIVIDGDEENHILVSCYSDEIIIKNTIIATGLSNTLHTIVGTFLGQDPEHTPTSTARGWIRDDQGTPTNTDRYTMVGGLPFNGLYSSSVNKMLLGYGSNKEFAFNISKDGQTHWLPEHNNQGTAFKIIEPVLIIDNKEVSLANMEYGRLYDGVSMSFVQELQCVFPNVSEPIAKMLISYGVGIDGVLSISGKMTFEQDVLVNNGYSLMMPLAWTTNNYVLDELVTSIGTATKNIGDNSNQQLTSESDQTYSFASIGGANKDYIAAMSIDYPNKTYRKGEIGRGNPFIFFNHRPAYPKLYPLTMFAHNAKTGEVYQFYGRFAVGKIQRIYDLIK